MTKQYRLGRVQRMANAIYARLTRQGLGAGYRHILTVRGRKSGVPRSTPVDVMTVDESMWLVAPYGTVDWVRNVRAAEEVELRRGHARRRFRAHEVVGAEAIPAIRAYIERVRVTRAYWEVAADAPDDEIVRAARTHPVFRLSPV